MDVVNWLRNESGLNLRQAYVVEHVLVMLDNVHRLDPCAADLMWFELYKQLDGIFGQNVQSIRINPINGALYNANLRDRFRHRLLFAMYDMVELIRNEDERIFTGIERFRRMIDLMFVTWEIEMMSGHWD